MSRSFRIYVFMIIPLTVIFEDHCSAKTQVITGYLNAPFGTSVTETLKKLPCSDTWQESTKVGEKFGVKLAKGFREFQCQRFASLASNNGRAILMFHDDKFIEISFQNSYDMRKKMKEQLPDFIEPSESEKADFSEGKKPISWYAAGRTVELTCDIYGSFQFRFRDYKYLGHKDFLEK